MVFDPIGENRRRETNREKLRRKKRDQERDSLDKSSKRITYNSKRINSDKEGMMMGESSSLSRFDEEEYIVFCFRDDGEIHVVKEKRPCHHDQIDRPKRRSRAVNHLKCDESAAENSNSSHVEDITTISDEQVEGERNDVEVDWPPDEIKDINQTGTPESKMSSVAESSDSNQSDASTDWDGNGWAALFICQSQKTHTCGSTRLGVFVFTAVDSEKLHLQFFNL
ncbi:hypothetical protein ACH5RR_025127 [Cinchona calisaya]|uniref:Uncharacterized protein n=1 Tax=Cinchona calisaya TaxID=153742 RepID=A0ABD2Z258_9GENT